MPVITNKIIAITGASSGIGKEVAIEAVQRGAKVVLMARSLDKLNEVAAICNELQTDSARVYQLDVSQTDKVDEVVNNIEHIDILVNAAGFGDFSEEFVNANFPTIREMFETNVLGLMYMSRIVAQKMISQGYGHIVNVGSMAGKIPTAKATAYAATKAAVIAFSDGLRLELKPFNIAVTSVNPGPVDTNFMGVADPNGGYVATLKKLPLSDMFFMKPENLAIDIVNIFGTKKREVNRPRFMAAASVLYNLVPSAGDYFTEQFGNIK